MARQLTDHGRGGSSFPVVFPINSPINKLNTIWRQLKSKRDDFARRRRYMLNSLPKDAELCLMICSIFPDDFMIPIDDLVAHGMGLKLFEDVHNILAARCRVNDIISIINNHEYAGQIRLLGPHNGRVKMLVGATSLANSISSWRPLVFRRDIIVEKLLNSNQYKDCFGLSLVVKKVDQFPVSLECPKLTLLLLQCRDDSKSISKGFFEGMKKLRVLSLDLASLSQSINVLQNLKTLRLKVPKFEDASWIGGLTSLEFLSIFVSSSTDIPKEIGQLENLRLLDLRKTNIAYIPQGILSRLLKLEALYMPLSFRRWGCKEKNGDDYDEWESREDFDDCDKISDKISEIDDGKRINATLTELVSLPLKALQISLPKASVLPKSPIFKSIQEFKIVMPDKFKHLPFGEDPVNELQLIGEASDIKESGICDLMSRTEELRLTRVTSLKNVLFQLEDGDFAQLKRMIIAECDELEYVVDMTKRRTLTKGEYLFGKLEYLHLSMLPRLKEICHGKLEYFRWFFNLTEISIRFCHELKYVFALSTVKGSKLKSIEILDCCKMEGIFYEDIPLTLSYIEKLELHSLPGLVSLLVQKDNTINRVQYDYNGPLTANTVSLISSEGTVNNTEIDCVLPSRLANSWLRKLKRLKIAFCDVKVIFWCEDSHDASGAFNSLKELELHGLQKLVHVWLQVPPQISAFQNLHLLVLSDCGNSYLFPSQVAMLLVQLQKVYIGRCERMEEVIAQDDENEREVKNLVFLPQLKLMEVQWMPSLKIFYGGIHEIYLLSLESLIFNQCNVLKCFSKGRLRTPQLERIEINRSLCPVIGDANAIIKRFVANQKGQLSIYDLEIATENFAPNYLVGKGDFSEVYKGWIGQKILAPSSPSTDMPVAIKKWKLKIQQQFKEWQMQAKFLESLSHPNLVKLLGHCWEDKKLVLMYEFTVRKSLDDYLFGGYSTMILPWNIRINIAIGAARGLNFLHGLRKKVIHGNIKPSNILLDENYGAKLTDFGGLAILWGLSDKNTGRRAVDIYGYTAPESLATGYVNAKSDVYGFGVVLLELMTGLCALDEKRPNGQENLVYWLKPILLQERLIENMMDARIKGEYSAKSMLLAANLALKCVEHDPENRPNMKEVVEALEQIDAIKKISVGIRVTRIPQLLSIANNYDMLDIIEPIELDPAIDS